MKNILFATSEAVPFIKTGGLADVAGALPKCFDKRYFDVRVILPKYACMKQEWKDRMEYITHFYMDLGYKNCYVGIMHLEYEGIHFYFIDNEYYFSGPKPYDSAPWDLEKFAFFSKAVLSVLPVINFRPDVIHCHDWQTGLVPVYLHDSFQQNEFFWGIKSIMTIHNLKFQGVWDVKTVQGITGLSDYYFAPDKLEAYKDANFLKGGIVFADAVTTVSNTYAEEIKTPFYGERLDGLLCARSHDLRGIVNGIDYDVFNPETGFFHPKDKDGKFIYPLDYRYDGGLGARDYYDENNGYIYRWDVQHNIGDLISLIGGNEAFTSALDSMFNTPLGMSKWQFYSTLPDHTGNVGMFSMANEPSLHIPYLYNYAGKPWMTQKRIRTLLNQWFRNDLMGVPGDEDGGGMSAFVVFSQMGFYPVTPGSPTYNIGSPMFTDVKVDMGNGNTFEIRANNASDENKYVQSAKLNGVTLNQPWFNHSDIAAGGLLELEMGPKANKEWGLGTPPPSAAPMPK